MRPPKYKIIRTMFQLEVIKTYFDEATQRWVTEVVGRTDSFAIAQRMLVELTDGAV